MEEQIQENLARPLAETGAEVMSGSEATNILNLYGVDPNSLYSQDNIESTLVRPEAAPDDLLGIRSQIQYDSGYSETKSKYDAIEKGINAYNTATKKGIADQGNWLLNAEAVVGEQQAFNTQRNLGLENLLLEKDTLSKRLNELGQEVNYRTQLAEKNIDLIRNLKLSYPGANIKFGDSMDKIEKRLEKFYKEEEKKAEKDELKKALRDLGLSTSGSRKELAKRLEKENAETYAMTKESSKLSLEELRISLQKAREGLGTGGNGVEQYFPSASNGNSTQTINNGWSVTKSTSDDPNQSGDPLTPFEQ